MNTSIAQRIRVPLGFCYGLLFLYLATPLPAFFYPGIVLAGLGSALRVWAAGHLNKGRELATSGPYSWTRNPLYLGSFFMGLGFTLAAANFWLAVLFPVLFVAIYIPVMKREEQELTRTFGVGYAVYRDQVALFLPLNPPFIPRREEGDSKPTGNFQWGKVICNREYRAVVGFFLVTALIWTKMFLWR
ncbi:MAG: isoprenylcysteine carboxylmethyltransferase family protein [Acidobacteria bacterium]|nr:MAG: isoprenylcysteine carboxylmethyltransferase family protein [Acidobacteriota bacterium]